MRTANREAPRCDFYSKPARGGNGTSGKSLVCPLFPLLLFPSPPSLTLCSVFSPPLPCCEPGPPVGEVKGKPVGVTQQIWQLTQHQPPVCLSSCHRDQRGLPWREEGGIGLPVFLTYGSRGERAAWDGRCLLQEQRGWSKRGGGGGGFFFFLFLLCSG